MITVVLVIHLLIALALIGTVLLQRSEGGGLGIGGGGGGGGGMSGFLTGRGTANLLTRTTAGLAAAFMATSLILTILANNMGSGSITEDLPSLAPAETQAPETGAPEALPPVQETPSAPSVPVE